MVQQGGASAQTRLIGPRFKRSASPYVYLFPTMLIMALLMVVPMVMVAQYSVMDNVITNKHPRFVGLANYLTVFRDAVFLEATGHTLYFTAMSVIFHMAIGLLFAMMLNAKSLPKAPKAILRAIYVMPWMFTATIVAILWRLLLDPSGVVNHVLRMLGAIDGYVEWFGSSATALNAVTFVNIWAGYPFYMVSLLAGLQGIPSDLYEAAMIDGAGGVRRFWHITIPQLMPIIRSIAMLDFIWTMQVFPLIWMTTGGGPIHATEMVSTFTYKLAFSSYKFSLASASAVVILVFSLAIAFVYVRYQKARD
ncbi:MAG: sugar ABC transporter permease [Christensenellaceae bacterium]|nr:sugar ABC transporter permease [Christensenellaceae bacterium]